MKPDVVTFGCRLNAYEAEVIRRNAEAAGIRDTVIVNTCTVTAEAERQARQTIRRIRRERPAAHIVVTGCGAQISPARFAAMPEVDRVVGNIEKLQPGIWTAASAGPRVQVSDIMAVRDMAGHLTEGFEGRVRAFLEVQQGCDHRCTFCIIPFGRGNSRSVPLGAVVDQARALVARGFREIVLTGVDLTAYGADLPGRPRLGEAVRRLLAAVPELPRLRLSSLDPAEIDDELIGLFAGNERLMPHVHLSLQAGSDTILKRMKRRHTREQALAAVTALRQARPDIAFGADLIAGFPTETDEMFAETLSLVDAAGLVWLHVFPYSARPGTPAARMPQVSASARRERAARLRAAGEAALGRWLESRVGSRVAVLVEQERIARDPYYAGVEIDRLIDPGSVIEATIDAARGGRLMARVAA